MTSDMSNRNPARDAIDRALNLAYLLSLRAARAGVVTYTERDLAWFRAPLRTVAP